MKDKTYDMKETEEGFEIEEKGKKLKAKKIRKEESKDGSTNN